MKRLTPMTLLSQQTEPYTKADISSTHQISCAYMSMSHSTGFLQSHNTESKQGDISPATTSLPFRQSPKFISADEVEWEFPSVVSTSPGI